MFKTLLKFILAFALIYWLIHSGKLDFSLLSKAIHNGPNWIIALLIFSLGAIITSYRFKLILETNTDKKFHLFDMARLTWIGLFFSSILPGAVTGDFIKLYYIKQLEPKFKKTFLITAVMLDRILGLLGLLFVSGIFSLVYFKEVTSISPKIVHIITVNLILFLGGVSLIFLLFLSKGIQRIILHFIFKIPKIGHKTVSILEQIFSLSHHHKTFITCFFMSVFTQFMNVLAFWTITSNFYTIHLPFNYLFTFIPFGLITVAIPISPGGLGVGHAIFQNLFLMVGINNGASLFNLYFMANLTINLIGIIPYLFAGKKPTNQEMEEFN